MAVLLMALLASMFRLEALASAVPDARAAEVRSEAGQTADLPAFELAPPRATARGLEQSDELADLLPLRRPCLAARPCALALLEPASTRGAHTSEAERMTALIALTLSQRAGLCIDDAHGRWSQIAGEPLRRCPHREARHLLHVRLDTAAEGFLATATFTEAVDALDAAAPTSQPMRRAPSIQQALPLDALEPLRLRLRTEFGEARDLAFAAEKLANALGDALGTERPSTFEVFLKPPEAPILHVNVKLGNTLAALDGFDFSAFTLRFDIEVDYYLRPYLLAFLEAGLAVGNAENTSASDSSGDVGAETSVPLVASGDEQEAQAGSAGKGSFSLVPVKIGLKYNPLHQYSVRPYLGAGIGLGILSDLVAAESREITLSFSGILGVAWVPFNHLGFNFETSFNFDELRVSGGSNVLFGFSINFGVLFLF